MQRRDKILPQIQQQFPNSGDYCGGYCGIEFHQAPPSQAPYAISDRFDVNSNRRITFCECRGTPTVQRAAFLSSKPWIVPFVISTFKQDTIGDLVALLPNEISIFGEQYVLAGYSMFAGGHFTCIVNIAIRDKQFYYDGITS